MSDEPQKSMDDLLTEAREARAAVKVAMDKVSEIEREVRARTFVGDKEWLSACLFLAHDWRVDDGDLLVRCIKTVPTPAPERVDFAPGDGLLISRIDNTTLRLTPATRTPHILAAWLAARLPNGRGCIPAHQVYQAQFWLELARLTSNTPTPETGCPHCAGDRQFEAWLIERVVERGHDRANAMPGTEERYIKAAKKAEAEAILREWRSQRGK